MTQGPEMLKVGRNELCPCGSRKKFKRCHIGNWPTRASHVAVDRKELRAPLTFTELARDPGLLAVHPVSIIAGALRFVHQQISLTDSRTKQGLHVRTAGATILAACYRDNIADVTTDEIPIIDGSSLLSQIEERLQMRFGSSVNEGLLTLLQIACTQGALQSNDAFALFRTLYLLELQDLEGTSDASPHDELFRATHGCTAEEYIAIFESLWATALRGEFVDRTALRLSPNAAHLAPIADSLLRTHSCKIQDVKSIIDNKIGHHGLDGLVAAFFARYPFVEFRPGLYFFAPHPYVRLSTMTGPFFQVLALARKQAGRPETSAGDRLSRRFEHLVRDLLLESFAPQQIVCEHPVTADVRRRSADLLLFEHDCATIVQAKIKRLPPPAFFGFSLTDFRHECGKAMAELVSKSVKYLTWLETPEADRLLTSDARYARDRLRGARRLFLLGLVPAMPSVFHLKPFRQMLWNGVLSRLTVPEKAWAERNRHRIVGWHVMDSEELAVFVGRRSEWGLQEALLEYLSTVALWKPGTDDGLPAPFSGYVSDRARRLGIGFSLPKVDAAVRRFHERGLMFTFDMSPADYDHFR